MKRNVSSILAGAALAAAPALAEFEGEIDMKITAQGGVVGRGRVFVSMPGSRTEMDMETAREQATKMVGEKEAYSVKRLGSEKVLGYSTKHVLLSRPMELTKAEKRSLPASLFAVPAGYAKQEGTMGTAGVMAPEASPPR